MPRAMHRWLIASVIAWGAMTGHARAQDVVAGNRYRQSPEVLAQFPNLDISLDTPALAPNRTTFTTQSELETYLLKLAKTNAPLVLQTLATSQQGRALPILYFTKERLTEPAAIRAAGRPIVWLIGQQHGNEPAGGEAMLALARALSEGELRPLLDKLSIVMVPRANPDGAASEQRDTAARMDLNRDHATMALSETRALHAAVQSMPPDLVVDAHEFSVARRWIEKFGGLQAVDLMILDATHPMVPPPIVKLARDLFTPAIDKAAKAKAISTFPYHTTSTRNGDRTISMGGNAPGIARNAFGLMGAVSFLLETRGVGIGMEGYQRRVATHYVAIKAILETAAAHSEQLRDAVAAARREITARTGEVVIGYTVENELAQLPVIDAATGERRTTEVQLANSKSFSLTASRPRPLGYVILPEARGGIAELQLFGAATCVVTAATDIDAEMFEIRDRSNVDRRAINPDAAVKAMLRSVNVHIPVGSVYVPMAQPAGTRIAAALEPDAPGSFVAQDVLRVPNEQITVPIVRVLPGTSLALKPSTQNQTTPCKLP